MAQPITWQNVNGPSLADAANPLKYAQQMFGGAFDGLQKELDKRQLTETQNWDQGVKNNTAAFLNSVDAPENTAAFDTQRAALKQQLSGMGAQVDQNAARVALDNRRGVLQQRGLTDIQANEAIAKEKAAPILEQARMYYEQGKPDAGNALIAANQGILGGSAAMEFGHGVGQRGVLEQRATEVNARAITANDQAVSMYGDQRALLKAQVNEANSRAEKNRQEKASTAAASASGASQISTDLSAGLKLFTNQNNAYLANTGKLATSLGIPLDKQGVPVFDKATPEQTLSFKTRLDKEIGAAPSASAMKSQMMQGWIQAGYHPTEINKGGKVIDENYGSGIYTAGVDAANITKISEASKAAREEAGKNNLFYNPASSSLAAQTEVLKSVDMGIKDTHFVGDIKPTIQKWMNEGLPMVKDGQHVLVPIPPKLMAAAFEAGKDPDSMVWNSTLGNVKDQLRTMLKDPSMLRMQQEAEQLKSGSGNSASELMNQRKVDVEGNSASTNELTKRLDLKMNMERERLNGASPK